MFGREDKQSAGKSGGKAFADVRSAAQDLHRLQREESEG